LNKLNKKEEQADKHTRKEAKISRRKTAQEQNTNGKHAECDHVKKCSEPTKQ
jgi:hypothetical protein